jgi:hypothetical protein
MLYHARSFIDRVSQLINKNALKVPLNETYGFQVGPEAYFDFDAFLYSAKSLFEGNIVLKGKKYFTKERRSRFLKIAREAYDGFIKSFLTPFRNEAVHLNYLGTSTSQMALLSNQNGTISVRMHTTFLVNGQEQNLLDIYHVLLALSLQVVRNLALIMIQEYASVFGRPNNLDIESHVGHSVFRIRELLEMKEWEAST